MPSPVVTTAALKPPPYVPLVGRSAMVGELGTAWPTEKVWAPPSAAVKSVPAATWAVNEQVPIPTYDTSRPSTVQTAVEFDVTETVPSPVVDTAAVKPPPYVPLAGRSEMAGALGVSKLTTWLSESELEG